MAEPLSITAGIIAVLQLTAKAVQYLNDVKDAPTDRQQILIEISTVSGFLHTLKDLAERMQPGNAHLAAMRSLNVPNGPLEQFKSALERLVSKLKPAHGLRKVATALTWTLDKGEVNSILSKIERQKALFLLALQNDHMLASTLVFHEKQVPWQLMTAGIEYGSALQWLSSTDPSSNHNVACKKHELTAGDWFLRSDDCERWKNDTNSFLWLHGKAGCGKTVLCSTIIEAVKTHTAALSGAALAYFYFDFNDAEKQRVKEFLCSFIAQLSQSTSRAAEKVQALYTRCQRGQQQPSMASLQICVREILEESPRTFLVLDALHECTEREELLDLIKELYSWRLPNVNVLATSRRELDIEQVLSPLSTCIIPIQSAKVDPDIRLYIDNRLHSDNKLKRWSKHADLMKEIETTLVDGADGMFRWVVCQTDALQKCLKIDAVRKALKTLPKTLDETYERILKSIDEDYQAEAFIALQWLAFSARPMRLEEIAEAVSMAGEDPPVYNPENRLSDPTDVVTICSSLVTGTARKMVYTGGSEVVNELRLAHFSVKEYLVSQRITGCFRIEEITANITLAKACLTYLLYFNFELVSEEVLDEYPLLSYAAEYWPEHMRAIPEGSSEPTLDSLVLKLLDSAEVHLLNWQKIYARDRYDVSSPDFSLTKKDIGNALYYSSHLGLSKVTCSLISSGEDIGFSGGPFGSALQAAALEGHETVVRLLLTAGADINAQDRKYGNALQAAVFCGHETTVQQLLTAGADVNAQCGHYGNALQTAAFCRHETMIQQLLTAEADVNAQCGHYGNALQTAAFYKHETMIQLLLTAGADINAQGGEYGSALQAAAAAYHEKETVIQLLLTAGADISAQGGMYGSALQAAAATLFENETVIQQLLTAGADINAQGGVYGNALQAAASEDRETVVWLLLTAGADINAQGGRYDNTLQAAASEGHETVVQLLLTAGADVNAQGEGYGSVLQAAAYEGHKTIVQLLLAAGADINAQGGEYESALQAAKSRGHEAVVQILLAEGAVDNL